MKAVYSLIVLLYFLTTTIACDSPHVSTNRIEIYASGEPGWHVVEFLYDSIHKDFEDISVRFRKPNSLETADIRSLNLSDYQTVILHKNGDTARKEFWHKGEYAIDSIPGIFIFFYVPNETELKTIGYPDVNTADSVRTVLDSVIKKYLRSKNIVR